MKISYDPAKRAITLRERALDFEDALEVFAGRTLEVEDTRMDYGETRILCVGFLKQRMVMLGYVQRGATRHIFSMRKCNAREIKRYGPHLA